MKSRNSAPKQFRFQEILDIEKQLAAASITVGGGDEDLAAILPNRALSYRPLSAEIHFDHAKQAIVLAPPDSQRRLNDQVMLAAAGLLTIEGLRFLQVGDYRQYGKVSSA